MTGSISDIDLSLANIWKSWHNLRKGKRNSRAIITFEYYLEDNLRQLHDTLNSGTYRHGGYDRFVVHDTKPREISVANVRDRVVHRLLYDYMVPLWDKTFINDVWSCRPNKGLHAGINRAQALMSRYPNSYIWRADIKKMFDSIDQSVMKQLLRRRIHDFRALQLLDCIIDSYDHELASKQASKQGLPIGNLTSQIMSNIYLNESDRLMKHTLKPLAYLRYGDDWLCFADSRQATELIRSQASLFLEQELSLIVNPKIDLVSPARLRVSYLGVDIWPTGRRLQKSVLSRVNQRLTSQNVGSYKAHIVAHEKPKRQKELNWQLIKSAGEGN